MTVLKHLIHVSLSVVDTVVHDFSALCNRNDGRIHESSVRLEVQSCISLLYLFVELRVYVHSIFLYKSLSCLVISFGLDSLDFCK